MVTLEELRVKVKQSGGKFRKYRNYNSHAYISVPTADGKILNINFILGGITNINILNNYLYTDKYIEWRLENNLI